MSETQWDITDKINLEKSAADILSKIADSASESATVLALHGDLGAGKTTFVQHLANLLGVTEPVTSPTFVIMKKYETTNDRFQNLVHIDAYRLETVDELEVLMFAQEVAKQSTIICIEWAEKVADILPETTLHLNFSLTSDGQRRISLA